MGVKEINKLIKSSATDYINQTKMNLNTESWMYVSDRMIENLNMMFHPVYKQKTTTQTVKRINIIID